MNTIIGFLIAIGWYIGYTFANAEFEAAVLGMLLGVATIASDRGK